MNQHTHTGTGPIDMAAWRQETSERLIQQEAVHEYQRRADDALRRLKTASEGLEPEQAIIIWQSVESLLKLAEKAAGSVIF